MVRRIERSNVQLKVTAIHLKTRQIIAKPAAFKINFLDVSEHLRTQEQLELGRKFLPAKINLFLK